MLIKCPQCAVGYNIPDNVIGDKPKKLSCAKCKHVFTITRRSDLPPRGYVEFTGKQQLPPEFAFLHSEAKPKSPSPGEPPPMPEEKTEPQPEEATTKIAIDRAAPPQQPPPRSSRRSFPAENMFGGAAPPAWETETPFELDNFADANAIPAGNQAVGKIMFGAILTVVGFLLFVAARNGWTISPLDLPSQIAFAFSGQELEQLPETVENLDTTIEEKRILLTEDKRTCLSVKGEIVNTNSSPRNHVLLRGRLVSPSGEIYSEVRFPCGRTVDDEAILKTPAGAMKGHYLVDTQTYNCHLSANGSTIFHAILEDVPGEYNDAFTIEITPVAATE